MNTFLFIYKDIMPIVSTPILFLNQKPLMNGQNTAKELFNILFSTISKKGVRIFLKIRTPLSIKHFHRLYINVSYCGCLPKYAAIPPSTYRICPLTKSDAEEARNTAGPCKSSGLPQRSAGVFDMMN